MKIKKNGKVINLTESDLKRIVKKVLNEGIVMTLPWENLYEVEPGDTFKLHDEEKEVLLKNGKENSRFGEWSVIKNPTGSQPFVGALTVKSFDDKTKAVTFTNGVVVGPK